jgi:phage-related protein
MKVLLLLSAMLFSGLSHAYTIYNCSNVLGEFSESSASGFLVIEKENNSAPFTVSMSESFLSFYEDFDATYSSLSVSKIDLIEEVESNSYQSKITITVNRLKIAGQKVKKTTTKLDALCDVVTYNF